MTIRYDGTDGTIETRDDLYNFMLKEFPDGSHPVIICNKPEEQREIIKLLSLDGFFKLTPLVSRLADFPRTSVLLSIMWWRDDDGSPLVGGVLREDWKNTTNIRFVDYIYYEDFRQAFSNSSDTKELERDDTEIDRFLLTLKEA